MRIHKEGYKIIGVTFLILVVLSMLVVWLIPYPFVRYFFYVGFFIHLLWTMRFFRYPQRTVNSGINHILSSADGKVVAIEETYEEEYFKEKRLLISVFMSPFNVHINWYPFNGNVKYVKYHEGKYLVAYHPKSSELNERNSIVIEKEPGKNIMMRQIAGIMARRIISYANEGDTAEQGGEFGIIRFGSRVDFYLPLDVDVKVKLNDKVKAQQTVIAEFK
ncbi:MAG: phosphatidylserine decarboxylase family protein [Bacteroidales bacterium]|jgi:phosphatidylserine decarboxylase|nr:phosphatidylserine decarboxylase family protein [Bacteroidales bacterium]